MVNEEGLEARLRQRLESHDALRHGLETVPAAGEIEPRGTLPNTPLCASLISFGLGACFAGGMAIFAFGGFAGQWWATDRLGFYLAAWSFFHWAEFATTAGWNRDKVSVDSFLLNNGAMYHVAHSSALVEYLFRRYWERTGRQLPLLPSSSSSYMAVIGIVMVILGQGLRSTAMMHAGSNFSHPVALSKRPGHRLVTDGIYRYLRHPSYTGFFYWAIGTQVVLGNGVCLAGFVVVLWRFFYERTRTEERALVRFFGNDYVDYRKRVGTLIPFI